MNGENNILATRIHALSGALFEQFCCEWLLLSPETTLLGARVIHAQPFARSGQAQDGIDIQVDMIRQTKEGEENRLRVVFQCKRTRDWDAAKTRDAIAKTAAAADECVLVLAMDTGGGADGPIQTAVNDYNATRTVGQPQWHVFFISDIERHISQRLKNPRGARLVTKYFGAGTSFDLLGITEASPLITELAITEGFRGSFSHSQDLFGRDDELRSLLAALTENHQAIILPAPGGEGKTRLLLELARQSAEGDIRRCVRFLDPCTPTELDEAMQWLPICDEFVIILDDAHKWQPDMRVHFEKMRRHWGKRLKLVIGTRPYRLSSVQRELVQAEIRPILTLPALTPIKRADQLALAKAALGADLSHQAKPLVDAAGGSPLIILTGAEHLKRNFGQVNLHQFADFRCEVLSRLFDSSKLAATHGCTELEVDETLDVLSLLSAAPIDHSLEEKTASFIGLTPPDFRRLLGILDQAGHLQIKTDRDAGVSTWRLTPDLAADYRACDASFDDSGNAKPLPARFWSQLGSDALLPSVLRNLSEAEYIVRLLYPNASRVTAPLVEALKKQYREAGWRRRVSILELWQTICLLQPHEALSQVYEALRLKDDRAAELPHELEIEFSMLPPTFEQVIEKCASIAEIIGTTHLDLVTTCLDLLWEMDAGCYGDHLPKVSSICSTACFGRPVFADAAMPWIKARIYNPALLPSHERLGGLLHAMLDGCFRLTKSEDEWTDSRTIQFSSYQLPLCPSKHLRQEALSICLHWLQSSIWQARLSAAYYFRHFFVPDQMPVKANGARAEDCKTWRQEQAIAFRALQKAIPTIRDSSTLWALRQTLINSLQSALHEKSGHHCIHELLEAMPDTLELRIHRLFLSSGDSDVPQSEAECSRRAHYQSGMQLDHQESIASVREEIDSRHQAWAAFVDECTHEVWRQVSDANGLWRFLQDWHPRLEKLGSVTFWPLITSIRKQHPELLPQLAACLYSSEDDTLDGLFQALDQAWHDDPATRIAWTLRALQSTRKTLVLEALRSLRYRTNISAGELDALRQYASHEDADYRSHVLSWAKEAHTYFRDLEAVFGILASVQVGMHETALIEQLRDAVRSWFDWPPLDGIPHGGEILQKLLLIPDLHQLGLDTLLETWSHHDPQQVVSFLDTRLDRWQQETDESYKPFGLLNLHSLDGVTRIRERLEEAFQHFIEAHQAGNERLAAVRCSWFKILSEGASQTYLEWLESQLPRFQENELTLALTPMRRASLPFSQPDLIEKILEQSAKQSASCQQTVRRRLHGSLIPRSFSAPPGQARGHDLHNRDRALELSAQYLHRPLLNAFYLEVVQSSERAIKRAEEESPL